MLTGLIMGSVSVRANTIDWPLDAIGEELRERTASVSTSVCVCVCVVARAMRMRERVCEFVCVATRALASSGQRLHWSLRAASGRSRRRRRRPRRHFVRVREP